MKIYKTTVKRFFTVPTTLGEVLSRLSPLSLENLKEAAAKGAVWHQKKGQGKILRIRSLDEMVKPEDIITLNYDLKVLRIPEIEDLEVIHENDKYGVWIKPAGVVPQGSPAGDHASLLRFVEKKKHKEVFLIHRLDRETAGMMLIGYTKEAAARLSDLFQTNKIKKEYEAIVLGYMEPGKKDTISASLDGKEAITHFEVLASKNDQSLLRLTIDTGRLHQIRRHLDFVGHPVIGDPKYGRGNKNREGMKLLASRLRFPDPWLRTEQDFSWEFHLTI